jgi:pSer/pThr/pTyr-binding forkhead associated (FHA) protein
MWKLAIEDDEGKQTVVPLTRDEYTIGRKDGNTIRLTERNVSREHARLIKKKPNGDGASASAPASPAIVLEDLTSYNGVFVNGLRVTHAQNLSHGDLVQIGDYRIVLQDEASPQSPGPAATPNDAKQTVPGAPAAHARANALVDRPNRLVMIAGTAPGAEFPLDRERMTIGRAEEATISVNHNSVSRIHCEVHALGDGRFEIVDKGSSNGVRVNGSDLRRGIIEPSDVIELGDVQFKFVGAGQIYRPTESQKLAALTKRDATEIVRGRRSSNVVPIAIFSVVVIAGTLGAWAYTRRDLEPHATTGAAGSSAPSPERTALDDAKALCASGDCEGAHKKIQAAVAESSPLRSSQDYKDLETLWADQSLARADTLTDAAAKEALYQRVAQDMSVDPTRRKVAADKVQQLEALADALPAPPAPAVPPSSTKAHADDTAAPAPAHSDAAPHRVAAVAAIDPPAPAAPPPPSPAVQTVSARGPAGVTVDDRERALALQGTQDSKALLKKQLEQRMNNGKASDTEIRLLIGTCKDLGDRACVQAARAALAQRQE